MGNELRLQEWAKFISFLASPNQRSSWNFVNSFSFYSETFLFPPELEKLFARLRVTIRTGMIYKYFSV